MTARNRIFFRKTIDRMRFLHYNRGMKTSSPRHPILESLIYLLRWTGIALVCGGIGGVLGALFAKAIGLAASAQQANRWLIFLLPLIGIVIVFLYRAAGEEKNRGTNMVLSAVTEKEKVSVPTGFLIFVSTVLSHLGGASMGREGAALQLGGWLGARLGELFRLDEKDRHTAVMCGMAALFAALFGTPVAAAIFCIEVASVGVFYYSALIPCIFSAFLGTGIATLLGVAPEVFALEGVPDLSPANVGLSVVLGLLCAFLAIGLVESFHGAEKLAKKYLKNAYVRAFVVGCLIVGLTLLLGTREYTGAGAGLIEKALAGETKAYHFVLKLAFTSLAIAGGFKGGEIVPTLSIGACFGALFGSLTGYPVSLGAACGMIALFAGATNCPIAALLIAMEMFRGVGLPYFAVTVAMSFILSGYYSLYGSQRFVYSKTKHEQRIQ